MATITSPNWVRNVGIPGSIAIYFACILLTAAVWLTQGSVVGSLAGGMCFGFAMSTKTFLGYKNTFLEAILSPLSFMAILGLYVWKEQALMPTTWEPAGYYDAVGVGGLFLAFGLSVVFNAVRNPRSYQEHDQPETTPVTVSGESALAEPVEQTTPSAIARTATAFGVFAMIASFVLNLATLRPDWISTSDIALSRYIVKSVYNYKNKDHLAYAMASLAEVSVQSTAVEGDSRRAQTRPWRTG